MGCTNAATPHYACRWIRSYSADEYLLLPALKETLLDGMAGRTPDAELQALYEEAMRLELRFFDAQPMGAV